MAHYSKVEINKLSFSERARLFSEEISKLETKYGVHLDGEFENGVVYVKDNKSGESVARDYEEAR